jgi:hypothetical protein
MSSFEGHVFPEMGNAFLGTVFISTTNIQHDADMGNFGVIDFFMNGSYPVG